jgi:hypothetical protein
MGLPLSVDYGSGMFIVMQEWRGNLRVMAVLLSLPLFQVRVVSHRSSFFLAFA